MTCVFSGTGRIESGNDNTFAVFSEVKDLNHVPRFSMFGIVALTATMRQ